MEKQTTGWFHCGRCGGLFLAPMGAGVPGRCPDCGREPVVEDAEVAFHQASADRSRSKSSRHRSDSGARGQASKKAVGTGSRLVIAVVAAWSLLLCGVVGLVTFMRDDPPPQEEPSAVGDQGQRLIQASYEPCFQAMAGFLVEALPESRARFVRKPAEVMGKMLRWDEELVVPEEDLELTPLICGLIETPEGQALECVWQFDGERKVEGVFYRDDARDTEHWRLDWELLSRYSDHSWTLFNAGVGDDSGEFRLLARRRAVNDEDKASSYLGIVLLAPNATYPEKVGAASPEILVPRNSPEGRVIEKAFERREAGGAAYGAMSSQFDPSGMIRLRVRVRRIDEVEKRFEVEKVLATHWLGIDDLGIEVD